MKALHSRREITATHFFSGVGPVTLIGLLSFGHNRDEGSCWSTSSGGEARHARHFAQYKPGISVRRPVRGCFSGDAFARNGNVSPDSRQT